VKFFNREDELSVLRNIEEQSKTHSQMTIIVGRRRIGKTTLIKKAYRDKLYLFVSKKNEALLCEEFIAIVQNTLDIKIFGTINRFAQLFEYLMELSKQRHFTLVIDEFQEFLTINPSIYSDMQNIWDSYKDTTHLNLVLSGSIYALMKKIFENQKEPLFGRANHKIHLKAFSIKTLQEIMVEYHPAYIPDDLLAFYMLTGGVAKYVEIFVDTHALTLERQLELIFSDASLFLEEGKNLLIEEFGKEYSTYFSILSLIASSKTSRSEMESILGKNIGGYLDRLEHEYTIIQKIKPIFAKEGNRVVKYEIVDNFFNFWFRFIYKYRSTIEIENYEYIKKIIYRDYATYSGKFLERYFIQKLKLSHQYSAIGTYWERGNQNEIDIVALNEEEQKILCIEVKRNPQKIDLKRLEEKSVKLLKRYTKYQFEYRGLSLEDIDNGE